jgi:hypothetical protein
VVSVISAVHFPRLPFISVVTFPSFILRQGPPVTPPESNEEHDPEVIVRGLEQTAKGI